MENDYIITSDGNLVSRAELRHWGVKGMKWGIRRYQNKDGSLTNAGKKRYAKLEAEMKVLKPKKTSKAEKAAETEKGARKKLVSEMTDDELRERTNRMRIEKEYYDAAHNLAVANPKQVSAGEKFMNSLLNDVIIPNAKSVGKDWVNKLMRESLGLNTKDNKDTKDNNSNKKDDRLEELEQKAKKLKAKKEIKEYKAEIKKLNDAKNKKDDELPPVKTWDDLEKKRKYLEAINNPGDNSNNQNNNNQNNNNKNNNNFGNNNSGNSNSNNNSTNNSNNNNSKAQQQSTNNKAPEQKPVTNTTKVKDVDYYSKESEKEVDRLLAEIDDYGWELYEKYYR